MKHFPGCVFQGVSMENVRRLEGLPAPGDRQGLALGGGEFHVPALLPISEPLEVFL